ncbi:MAG: hypothetical protein N2249_00825 [Melioribacter sp.]|nr:hypothetical protein [Melioribacter sp.]
MNFISRLLVILFLLLFYFCKDDTVIYEANAILYQIDGCQPKLEKKSFGDTCFKYTFSDKLIIDFCVSGNCCPDKNRYLITHKIFKDTITITVKDTAANLCRCICNYIIHCEFELLNYDNYVVKCMLDKTKNYELLYLQKVIRFY